MSALVHRVLCGVDFSPPSLVALDVAIAWARAHGAPLLVAHAYASPPLPYLEPGIVVIDEERLAAMIERELRDRVDRRAAHDMQVDCRAVFGPPAPALLAAAHAARCDLVVLGTRGLGGVPRFLLGSVADRVARLARQPVLIVPAQPAPRAIRTIVCAHDFSHRSSAALRLAAALAVLHRARLHVVHACEPHAATPLELRLAAAHERELAAMLACEAQGAGAPGITQVVRRGPAYRIIADEARAERADLIVLGSTGHSGPARFLLGSVAERVLRVSEVPALIVRE